MQFKKTTLLFITLLAFLLLLICGFNYIVNPYGVFTHSLFKHEQPAGRTNVRLVTAYNLKNHDYNGLIFGSSRGSMGIDPNSEYLTGSWYNASLPGASLTEIHYYIQHAFTNNQKLNKIILGLDYYLFKKEGREFREDFSLARLNTDEANTIFYKDYFDSLLSIDSVKSSIFTIKNEGIQNQFLNGLWHTKSTSSSDEKMSKEIFERVAKNISQQPMVLDDKKFEILNEILYFCHQNNIDLILYLHPLHQYTKSYLKFESGNDEKLVLGISKSNHETALKGGYRAFDFWDFSSPNSITSLNFKDEKLFEYYFEGSHYTPKTGNMILCKLLKHEQCIAPSDFGQKIPNL